MFTKDGVADEGFGFILLDGSDAILSSCKEMEYIAPNLESYYAKKFLKHSTSKDCGFDYEDATKLLNHIKQLAGECNE